MACTVHDSGNGRHAFTQRSAASARQSRARMTLASVLLATLAFAVPPAHAKIVDVIEYYNASQNHYFMTSLPAEIAALDAGTIKGWKRTGMEFRANDKPVNGTAAVASSSSGRP